uniref:Uncharacterized protein n=1 Tax=Hyaloperonospora arabidopsidis (strain Emoy2) TaxID=559515 RepID=M4BA32_HYAAE
MQSWISWRLVASTGTSFAYRLAWRILKIFGPISSRHLLPLAHLLRLKIQCGSE